MNFPARLARVLSELMGSADYIPPRQPSKLMADFYLLQLLDTGAQHIPSHRQQELDFELQQVRQTLIPYLRQHLLVKAGYAIACELRHLFDEADFNRPEDDGGDLAQDRNQPVLIRQQLVYHGMPPALANYFMGLTQGRMLRRPEPGALTVADYLQCARAGLALFDPGQVRWMELFGGEPWQQACRSWLSLYGARTLPDMAVYIDKLYSTEHNSGALLDKNKDYQGRWIKGLLDLKFQANDPEQLMHYASGYLQRLGRMVLKDRFGRGQDRSPVRPQGRLDLRVLAAEVVGALEHAGFDTDRQYTTYLVYRQQTKLGHLQVLDNGDVEVHTPDSGVQLEPGPQLAAQVVQLYTQAAMQASAIQSQDDDFRWDDIDSLAP